MNSPNCSNSTLMFAILLVEILARLVTLSIIFLIVVEKASVTDLGIRDVRSIRPAEATNCSVLERLRSIALIFGPVTRLHAFPSLAMRGSMIDFSARVVIHSIDL